MLLVVIEALVYSGQNHPKTWRNESLPKCPLVCTMLAYFWDEFILQVPSSKGSTTPNSSISNMACLPEDRLSNNVSGSTPSPPPPVLDPPMSSTTAIYARVNPNMKRDKTSNAVNNNFTSTFAPLQQQAINSRSATESTGDFKIQGEPLITLQFRQCTLELIFNL